MLVVHPLRANSLFVKAGLFGYLTDIVQMILTGKNRTRG